MDEYAHGMRTRDFSEFFLKLINCNTFLTLAKKLRKNIVKCYRYRSRSRLEKKSGAGAGAAKKLAGSSALQEDKKHKEIVL